MSLKKDLKLALNGLLKKELITMSALVIRIPEIPSGYIYSDVSIGWVGPMQVSVCQISEPVHSSQVNPSPWKPLLTAAARRSDGI
jgi:hypothetical protein